MNIEAKVSVKNKFEFVVRDAITGEVKQTAVAYNTVTNRLLTALANGSVSLQYLHIGTGVGEPAPTDTLLFKAMLMKYATLEDYGFDPKTNVGFQRRVARLAASDLVGEKLTEIGLSDSGYVSSNIYTHAMISDSEGRPIAISKTATDIIDIYATVYVTLPDLTESLGGGGWVSVIHSNDPVTNYVMASRVANMNFVFDTPTLMSYAFKGSSGILPGPSISGSASVLKAAAVVGSTRKITYRYNEANGNGIIGGLYFKGLLLETPSNLWAGKNFIGTAVGVGNGSNKRFNLSKQGVKASSVVLKRGGVVIPREEYIVNPSIIVTKSATYDSFYSQFVPITERVRVVVPVPNKIGLFWAITDIAIYTLKYNAVDLTLDILYTRNIKDAIQAATPANYAVNIVSLLGGKAVGLHTYYGSPLIFDCDANTGSIGQEWTKHANFPNFTSTNNNNIGLSAFGDSSFVVARPISGGFSGHYLFSFSLDEVTKTFGMHINTAATVASTPTVLLHHVTHPRLFLTNDMQRRIPYEKATGVFGAATTVTLTPSMPNMSNLKWDSKGTTLLAISSTGGTFVRTVPYDPILDTFGVAKDNACSYEYSPICEVGDTLVVKATYDSVCRIGNYAVDAVMPNEVLVQPSIVYTSSTRSNNGEVFSAPLGDEYMLVVPASVYNGRPAGFMVLFHKMVNNEVNNIVFNNPPADGDIITADFMVERIPKDTGNVLDVELSVTFGGS